MNGLATDIRFALRLMRRQPLLTLVAFTSLLIGIALNALLFTITNAVLFRPLALRDPATLSVLLLQRPASLMHNFSYPDYVTLRDSAKQVEGLVAYSVAEATAKGTGIAEVLDGEFVSGNMFMVLGVPVREGRGIMPSDDTASAPPAVVVSQRFWTQHFGTAPLTAQVVTLNGQPFTIVGIAERSFEGMQVGRASAFWVPFAQARALTGQEMLSRPTMSWLTLMARLPSPTAAEAARQELDAIIRRAFESRGRTYEPMVLQPGAQGDSMLPATLGSPLGLLSVAGALVLLVACMNVANLQLARADARRLELAVRAALGARLSQLVRLMLTDSLLLAIAAGVVSVGLVYLLKDQAAALIASFGRPVDLIVPVDDRVLMVVAALTVAAAMVIGLFATWQIIRRQPADTLGEARTVTVTRRLVPAGIDRRAVRPVHGGHDRCRVARSHTREPPQHGPRVRSRRRWRSSRSLRAWPRSSGLPLHATSSRSMKRYVLFLAVRASAAAHVMPLDFGGSRTTVDVAGYKPSPDEDMELNFVRVSPGQLRDGGHPDQPRPVHFAAGHRRAAGAHRRQRDDGAAILAERRCGRPVPAHG